MLMSLLILALIAYLVFWVMGQLSLPQPIRTVVMIILGIIFIVALLSYLPGNPLGTLR